MNESVSEQAHHQPVSARSNDKQPSNSPGLNFGRLQPAVRPQASGVGQKKQREGSVSRCDWQGQVQQSPQSPSCLQARKARYNPVKDVPWDPEKHHADQRPATISPVLYANLTQRQPRGSNRRLRNRAQANQ